MVERKPNKKTPNLLISFTPEFYCPPAFITRISENPILLKEKMDVAYNEVVKEREAEER